MEFNRYSRQLFEPIRPTVFRLLAALVLPALASQAHPAAAQPAPVAPIRFLAPLPFEVRGDASLKPLALAAPELLASHLSRVGGIRIVERIQIDKMFNEWKFQLGNLVDEKSAVEVGRAKGADTLLLGSISPIPGGNELLIQARLVDASSGVVRMSGDVSRREARSPMGWPGSHTGCPVHRARPMPRRQPHRRPLGSCLRRRMPLTHSPSAWSTSTKVNRIRPPPSSTAPSRKIRRSRRPAPLWRWRVRH